MKIFIIFVIFVMFFLNSCASLDIKTPDGAEFHSATLFKDIDVNDITINKPDGTQVHISGASTTSSYADSIIATIVGALIVIIGG